MIPVSSVLCFLIQTPQSMPRAEAFSIGHTWEKSMRLTDYLGQASSWAPWWLTRMVLCLRGNCWSPDYPKDRSSSQPRCEEALEGETVRSMSRTGTFG